MRSLDSRYRLIETHCRRFNGCLKQIEYRNPSGTQIQDRIEQAERLFEQDPKYKDGFKFHHVFRLFKEFGKFDDNVSQPRSRRRDFDTLNDSSESDVPYDGQPTPESPGLSSFSPQQSDDEKLSNNNLKQPNHHLTRVNLDFSTISGMPEEI
ncbi:Unknown protein [Striga hermonthica]|uniref:Uncharacterized protein n=1 Tax=Striga hermonthica TaxID=68872 RepID=A0A9N7P018_STRHE|nr:Unknown protein [Striga hermonthica]